MKFHNQRKGMTVWIGLLTALLWGGQVIADGYIQAIETERSEIEFELRYDSQDAPEALSYSSVALPTLSSQVLVFRATAIHAGIPVAVGPGIRAPPFHTSA